MKAPTSGTWFAHVVDGRRRVTMSCGFNVSKQAVIVGRGRYVDLEDCMPLTSIEEAAVPSGRSR